MIPCKIALLAKSCNSDWNCFINLGEVFDIKIKNDIGKLYQLHFTTKYLYPFNITIEDNKIIPCNLEEITNIQNKYNLTRILSITGKKHNNSFETPVLYDLTCMVPLFSPKIERLKINNIPQTGLRIIIILPYTNPIKRGKIIENCLLLSYQPKTVFYSIGGIKGRNTVSIYELTKRYLLSAGVKEENIYGSEYDNKKDSIIEAIGMLKFILGDISSAEIILGVSHKEMNYFLQLIRSNRLSNKLKNKLQLISNKF
jgi:hypothetical protein